MIGGSAATHVRAATTPRRGDLVFILGYPDQIGIDASGEIGFVWSSPGGYREPLTTLAVVERTRPLTLSPLAGAIPTGGASGGPVFDRNGRLVGIFSAVNHVEIRGEVRYSYTASSVAVTAEGLRLAPRHTPGASPQSD